jgi:hypothetical protein
MSNLNNIKIELNSYYFIITILVIIFSASIYLIKYVDFIGKELEDKEKKPQSNIIMKAHLNPENILEKYSSFILPLVALISFFIACFFVSKVLIIGVPSGKVKYFGIYFIVIITAILIVFNNSVLKEEKVIHYIKGRKFSVVGMLMVLGISALFFGFIDNFGLQLGIEALDNSFLNIFLGPLSEDTRFKKEKKSISRNLQYMNNWANGKWRAVLNQTLRFKEEIRKIKHPKINQLMEDIDELIDEQGGKPMEVPLNVKNQGLIGDYIQNIKRKYDLIEGSKAMMGNTFSNVIGALLSSALINLFTYMTKYDGIYSGDEEIDSSFFVSKINSYLPFLEGFFIMIGCLIPVVLNIAMKKDNYNTNNSKSWIILSIIAIIAIIMMFLSVKDSKKMTVKDKENSVRKTLIDLKKRLDITENDKELNNKIDNFVKN